MCETCEKSYKPNPMCNELSHTHHIEQHLRMIVILHFIMRARFQCFSGVFIINNVLRSLRLSSLAR